MTPLPFVRTLKVGSFGYDVWGAKRAVSEADARRFYDRLTIGDDCWLWIRGCFDDGYGAFKVNGKQQLAHRVMWQIIYGHIPDGLWVLHKCDMKACVRPDHLYLGTHADNTWDAVQRDRVAYGTRVGGVKLTEQEVLEIRRKHAAGSSIRGLGREFKVTSQNISCIVKGRTWKRLAA